MQSTDILAGLPAGLYTLTASGELGTYDAQRQLHIDAPLSQAFAEHNRAFLRSYLDGAEASDQRIAILFAADQPRAWGHLTLDLEDTVVSNLYPASRTTGGLTAFQQKSREMSMYRGMEMLLDYRRSGAAEMPVYCPVLFNPHVTLGQRVSALGRKPSEAEHAIPVIDVLNLAATIPAARRAAPAILELVEKLRQGVIRKDQRRDSLLSLRNTGPQADASDALRGAAIPGMDERRLHETEHVESVERWLKAPHQTVSTERLRSFVQFRGLDDVQLAALGAHSPIYTAPSGTRLLERGLRDAWNLYLLDGSLILTPADGSTLRVDSGTDKAARPIGALKPRQYAIDTLTPATFLWVHDQFLKAVLSGGKNPAG